MLVGSILALFTKLPTKPLQVTGKGIEWAWLDGAEYATTEETCPGARRAAFVSGYLPPDHKTCKESTWLDWFHVGNDGQSPDAPAGQVPQEQVP